MAGGPGSRIRNLREKQLLTQQTLAERASMSVSFLSEIENEKRNPSGRVLLNIATSLGTTMDYLIRGTEPPSRVETAPRPIPAGLAAAAEKAGLSYRTTATLHDAYRQIVARRGREPEREPTADDWLAMYQALREYIEG